MPASTHKKHPVTLYERTTGCFFNCELEKSPVLGMHYGFLFNVCGSFHSGWPLHPHQQKRCESLLSSNTAHCPLHLFLGWFRSRYPQAEYPPPRPLDMCDTWSLGDPCSSLISEQPTVHRISMNFLLLLLVNILSLFLFFNIHPLKGQKVPASQSASLSSIVLLCWCSRQTWKCRDSHITSLCVSIPHKEHREFWRKKLDFPEEPCDWRELAHGYEQ